MIWTHKQDNANGNPKELPKYVQQGAIDLQKAKERGVSSREILSGWYKSIPEVVAASRLRTDALMQQSDIESDIRINYTGPLTPDQQLELNILKRRHQALQEQSEQAAVEYKKRLPFSQTVRDYGLSANIFSMYSDGS